VAGGYLRYNLSDDGFIVNWLVAGPVVEPESGQTWDPAIGIEGPPVERGPLDAGHFRAGSTTGVWTYVACPEDHAIDHSATYAAPSFVRTWAYVELITDTPRSATLTITSDATFGLWLDDAPTLQDQMGTAASHVELRAGVTRLTIRTQQIGRHATPHALTLHIEPADGTHVRLPTLIANTGRRNALETLTAGVYLEREVYAGDTPIILRWPDDDRAFCAVHVRLHDSQERIYALADKSGHPGDSVDLGHALQLPAGPMHVTLMPSADEVYLEDMRFARHIPFWSMGQRTHATRIPGERTTRRVEALVAIAAMAHTPLAQIAHMALGAWHDLDVTSLVESQHQPTPDLLLAHVGALYRFGEDAAFPNDVRQAFETAVLAFAHWDKTLLSASAEVLAGQRWSEQTWADGRTGASHRAHAEALVLDWMQRFGRYGSACPSALELHDATAALCHLAELADAPQVYELAAVCLDKLLFMLALHLRHGVFGAAGLVCPPSLVKSGYRQPTAGISRLLWGSGIYNQYALGPLSLACATAYQAPPVLDAIAHDATPAMWSEERHAPPDAEATEIVAYRTPEYVLSSLRGAAAGRAGRSELTWRATLGPEALVFANQPGSSSETDARVPGYWAGNARVPHVVQWQDVVLAMHRLSPDDVFGFTHVYFPIATFDEYCSSDGWVFGRVGDGYVALANTIGMTLTREGRYAFRELRAFGLEQTWIVQMGRAAVDGTFADFQAAVCATRIDRSTAGVTYLGVHGQQLTVVWGVPLSVDGVPQRSSAAQHFANPYTSAELACETIEVRHGADYLRLDVSPLPVDPGEASC
jgi:hypothetical protein